MQTLIWNNLTQEEKTPSAYPSGTKKLVKALKQALGDKRGDRSLRLCAPDG